MSDLSEIDADGTILSSLDDEMVAAALPSPKGGYFAFQELCEVHNDHDPDWASVELDPFPPFVQNLLSDGLAFEERMGYEWEQHLQPQDLSDDLLDLAEDGREVTAEGSAGYLTDLASRINGERSVWIPESDEDRTVTSKRSRENLTIAAMEAGAPFIWNSRLPAAGTRVSEPDALVRASCGGYHPVDVKDASAFEAATSSDSSGSKRFFQSAMEAPAREDASYRVASKDASGMKTKHLLQLAHYHVHLEDLGYAASSPWGAILGRERRLVWANLRAPKKREDPFTGKRTVMSLLEYYRKSFDYRLEVALVAKDRTKAQLARPALKSACGACKFRTSCRNLLESESHVSLVLGVTEHQSSQHAKAGVVSMNDLLYIDRPTSVLIGTGLKATDVYDKALSASPSDPIERLLRKNTSSEKIASLKAAGLSTARDVLRTDYDVLERYDGIKAGYLPAHVDAARARRTGKVYLARGLDDFELPTADIEIDVDMENDPSPDGIIYLWGTWMKVWGDDMRIPGDAYRPFVTWDGTPEAEARVFADFWRWLSSMRVLAESTGTSLRAYCYSAAEVRCMRSIVSRHAGQPGIPTAEELEEFVSSDQWVDLYTVVRSQFVWPTDDLSLKSVAKWARHTWRDPDPGGDESVVWYRQAVEGDAAMQKRLLEYNEDDVIATKVVRKTLIGLRRKGIQRISDLDARFAHRTQVRTAPVRN